MPTKTQENVYNYLIATGVVGLIAVYVPLHAILRSSHLRTAYRAAAIFCALLSSAACFAGAGLGGKLWQTLPTGVFMLFLGAIVGLRVAGGWHVVRHRARAPKRFKAAVVEDVHWREDVSREEWNRMAARSGMGAAGLVLGGESDQDAVAVGLLGGRFWATRSGELGYEAVPLLYRHEPMGLVLLGLVQYRGRWMGPLLEKLRGATLERRMYAALHHAGALVWFLGMICGALAKTSWWPGEEVVEVLGGDPVYQGSTTLRVGGIWMQTILLLVAVFAFPYTRGVVRLGAAVAPRLALLWGQAVISLGIGLASIIWARDMKIVGTSIAYAGTLSLAAFAATAWSVLSVWAYNNGVGRLLRSAQDTSSSDEAVEEGDIPFSGVSSRRRAYLACLLTRPRNGYAGKFPVVRWGDITKGGMRARGLEIALETGAADSSEDPSEPFSTSVLEDVPVDEEWSVLENAANRRTFGM